MIGAMTGTRVVMAAIGMLVLGVTACSGSDPEPRVAPSPSPSSSTTASPSSSPGPTPPTLPATAIRRTDRGAEAFVHYFLDVLNFAQRSGDTAELRRISSAACAGCRGYVDAIQSTYSSGGRVEGGRISVGNLQELPVDYGADWGAFGTGSAGAQQIYDRDGGYESFAGGPVRLFVYTKWVGAEWAMQWIRTPA